MGEYAAVAVRERFRKEAMRVEASRECAAAMEAWSDGHVRFARSQGSRDGTLSSLSMSVMPHPYGEKEYARDGDWVVRTGPEHFQVLGDQAFREHYETEG